MRQDGFVSSHLIFLILSPSQQLEKAACGTQRFGFERRPSTELFHIPASRTASLDFRRTEAGSLADDNTSGHCGDTSAAFLRSSDFTGDTEIALSSSSEPTNREMRLNVPKTQVRWRWVFRVPRRSSALTGLGRESDSTNHTQRVPQWLHVQPSFHWHRPHLCVRCSHDLTVLCVCT